jgi:hypothetical protein
MKDESIRKSLESIARNNIPENTNLWPRLAARLEHKYMLPMTVKWKLVWTIVLVLLGLSAVTGAAYAFYRYFNDAGLESVSQAGLVSTVNATAQPTRLPTATLPEPVTVIGDSQTLEGVSLTLEWVYLMDGQQAFGFSANGLEGGKTLGMPKMAFGRLIPEQYRGAGLAIKDDTQPVVGTFVVNQIVRDDATFGKSDTRSDVSIVIPLLDGNGQVLNTFRFKVKNELVHAGPFAGGNTYSTRSNGLEISLDWIQLKSKTVQARLCFTSPGEKDWSLVAPTLQLGADPNQVAASVPVPASQSTTLTTENGIRCEQVTFPVSPVGAQAFYLVVKRLASSSGEILSGEWAFNWNQLPERMQFPGIVPLEPTQLSENIGGDVTVTLVKAYADVARMLFFVNMQGPRAGYSIFNAELKDANGNALNTGIGIGSPPDDPSLWSIEFYPEAEFVPGTFRGQLTLGITAQPGDGSWEVEAKFDLDLPVYLAVIYEPRQIVTANGVEMLLQRVEITPSYTQVILCYPKPTSADWSIGLSALVTVGKDSAGLQSARLLFDSQGGYGPKNPAPDWSPPIKTGRCVKAGFPVGHHGRPEGLVLNIAELEQSFPEVIPDEQIQAARQKLLAQGIDMDWVTSSGNGGGGGGPVINKKPEGMTDEQVMRVFYEALGYYYPGPWTFMMEIKP